jgi:hypothetical protein
MTYGPDAVFNQLTEEMCSQLYCYPNINSSYVFTTGPQGVGAAEGTVCGSGKVCSKNKCVQSPVAPVGSCLFGDLFIRVENDTYGISCEEGISRLLSLNLSLKIICSTEYFTTQCCSTCKSK